MPNWVFNTLTVEKKYKDLIVGENNRVDFNKLNPMPETFHDTIAPVRKDAIYLYLSEKGKKKVMPSTLMKYGIDRDDINAVTKLLEDDTPKYSNFGPFNDRKQLTHDEYVDEFYDLGKRYVFNMENYGIYDWYEWSYKHWGVKWNASESDYYENGKLIVFNFDTPWGYPDAWLEELAKKCSFHLAWEEEQGYRGIVFSNGHGDIEEEEMEMLEWDEDGECIETGDYGDCWQEYCLDAVFKKGA